jgi:flagella basal body P-ring formation protein FlgA
MNAMRRLLAPALLLALAAPASAQDARPAPTLRAHVVVDSDLVRIGDLVDHAGAAANIAVFRSPDLGQTGQVPAGRIVDALRAHNVIAIDMKGLKDISVTRAGETLTQSDLEARIAAALSAQYRLGDAANLGVAFDRPVAALHVEPGRARTIAMTRLVYDPRSRRFDAAFDIPVNETTRPLRVSGTASEMTDLLTLARPLARGEVLRAADIVVERRPKTEAAADTVSDAKAAIGLAARGAMRAGATLRRADLMKPELVARNETVTLLFEVPGMTLTVRGTAQEAGSEGDTVSVLNTQSKRVVQGVIAGPGRVIVTTVAPRVISQSSKQSVAALNAAQRNAE